MYGFTDEHLVARAPNVNLWRADDVLCVHVHGDLDDAASDRWRAIVTDDIAKEGPPRFIAVDFSREFEACIGSMRSGERPRRESSKRAS